MKEWKKNANKNETLSPYMTARVIAIIGVHAAKNQTGYLATLANFGTANTAMVEDSIKMLRRTANNELDSMLHEFHEMYLCFLHNAGQLEKTDTLAKYF